MTLLHGLAASSFEWYDPLASSGPTSIGAQEPPRARLHHGLPRPRGQRPMTSSVGTTAVVLRTGGTAPRVWPMTADDVLDLPPAELRARAAQVRDRHTGTRITYSPKVFIPLTMLCRDRCGYCTFAKAPARLSAPYLSPDEVLAIARAGAAAGCSEALFTLGEATRGTVPGGRRMAGRTRVRLDRRLPGGGVPARHRGDRPAASRQRRCPLAPMSWPPCAPSAPPRA